MSLLSVETTQPGRSYRRIVGRYHGERPGPSIVVVGGIHGNEDAGILALKRVFKTLEKIRPTFSGQLVGIAGNLTALQRGERFISEDLNRAWTPDRVARIKRADPNPLEQIEDIEMHGLLTALEAAFDSARGPVYFLDLHTSSAPGAPFVLLGDTLRNRRFALKFPVPVILGLEEQIDGVLLEYVNSLGHIALGFEAGQHDAPESIDYFEAALWIALIEAGAIDANHVPEAHTARERLTRSVDHLPSVLEIRYRHGIEPDDGFTMRPGFTNFKVVRAGDVLASDEEGEVRARCHGRVLLPLYQGQGNDGFFIAREVRPFWLRVSSILRHLRVDRLVSLLPGIRRDPEQPESLIVSRIAHRPALSLLHLLGFRKVREVGQNLIVSRRRYDLRGPNQNSAAQDGSSDPSVDPQP
ncbi:MAG: succinylglutamate desuccinylase/aspartoacylase family protein [Phycisphaerae bacterium]